MHESSAHVQASDWGLSVLDTGGAICLVCGSRFTKMHNARRHYREKHSMRTLGATFSCHVCYKHFNLVRTRNDHLLVKHGISPKMFKSSFMPASSMSD